MGRWEVEDKWGVWEVEDKWGYVGGRRQMGVCGR